MRIIFSGIMLALFAVSILGQEAERVRLQFVIVGYAAGVAITSLTVEDP